MIMIFVLIYEMSVICFLLFVITFIHFDTVIHDFDETINWSYDNDIFLFFA